MPATLDRNESAGEKAVESQDQQFEDNLSVTKHSITLGGRTIHYTVTTGTIILKEETEEDGKASGAKAKASIFFVAYIRDGVRTNRPLTFAFNGGPGSSSVWLHLGLLGPRRIQIEDDIHPPPPPYNLVENEYSLLDVSDLVFIDPVSTGFSRPVPGEKTKEFHDFKKDIESVAEFIRLYTSRFRRWSSPKFLVGESYGTTRAAGLAGHLQERHGMYLNGLMLVSSVLNFQTVRFTTGNDLPYILFLPSYTATARYHNRLPEDLNVELPQVLQEVTAFAIGPYTLALMQGAALPEKERGRVVKRLSRYTGLSEEFIERCDLRVEIHRFVKELLRDQGRTVGRLDSRYTGIDRDSAGEHYEYDPSLALIRGAFTATLNDYIRGELAFESDLQYEVLADLWQNWRYEQHQNEYVNVAETLRKAMSMNPNLQVFVANGYYDLATPFLATEYTFNHLQLDADLKQNISMAYYDAGHMMYLHQPSLQQLKRDLAAFVNSAIP